MLLSATIGLLLLALFAGYLAGLGRRLEVPVIVRDLFFVMAFTAALLFAAVIATT